MNRINGIIAGLSFLGLLSASGYAEMDGRLYSSGSTAVGCNAYQRAQCRQALL